MEQADTHRFKTLLERIRDELLATDDTGRDAAGTVVLDQSSVGRLSRMDAMQSQAIAIEAQRRRELQLKRIELALARIAAAEYGVCMDCDEYIDPRRLEIDPTATLCIACANKRDS
ncbi:MAG: TraR/DksA C4-type zinc finger protein [Gammaproteobacteria bacterium]|nr:TraR/DksA C4-type zinc finger protein [Gammaproteobacteria bacterium]